MIRGILAVVALCAPVWAAAEDDLVTALLKLPGPPPDWRAQVIPGATSRPENLPPPGDAPADDLLEFWSVTRWGGDAVKPSDAVRRRLLAAALAAPEDLPAVAGYFPDEAGTYDKVKAVYDRLADDPAYAGAWRRRVHHFLMMNSRHFRADLVAAARAAPAEPMEGPGPHAALVALARLDPGAAVPILKEQAVSPHAFVRAGVLAILYRQGVAAKAVDVARSRELLKTWAADREADPAVRYLAITELADPPWPGRDEFMLSLLADPTAREIRVGHTVYDPLGYAFARDEDYWAPRLLKLVGHADRAVHDAAVEHLVPWRSREGEPWRADVVRALLPWLADPDWAGGAIGRGRLIQALGQVEVAGTAPALERLLTTEVGELRGDVAAALVRQRARGAGVAKAARAAFEMETGERIRRQFARALVVSGELTEAEVVAAIEAAARSPGSKDGLRDPFFGGIFGNASDRPLPAAVSLGRHLARLGEGDEKAWPSDRALLLPAAGLGPVHRAAGAVLARAEALGAAEPGVADAMRALVSDWAVPEVSRDFVRRLGAGRVTAQEVQAFAARAERVRRDAAAELRALVSEGGVRGATAAGLLGEAAACDAMLTRGEAPQQLALLVAARLARTPLTLTAVEPLLNSPHLRVALAADQYLAANDSPEARHILLARHAGRARVLGGRFDTDIDFGEGAIDPFADDEERLRADVLAADGPAEVFALLRASGEPGAIVVRVRPGRADHLTVEFENGRSLVRDLTAAESAELRAFVADRRVDDLARLETGTIDGDHYQYVHVTRAGGRRVNMNNPGTGDSALTTYDRLVRLFARLGRAGEPRLRYAMLDAVPGAAVAFAHPAVRVTAAWAEPDGGGDLRVWAGLGYDAPAWRRVSGGKLGGPVEAPPGWAVGWLGTHDERQRLWDYPPGLVRLHDEAPRWAATTADGRVVLAASTAHGQRARLWVWRRGADPQPLTPEGRSFGQPVLSADGRWVIATEGARVVRIRLPDGRPEAVDLPEGFSPEPVAYVSAHGKFLVRGSKLGEGFTSVTRHWLVDPADGSARQVNGEFAPLSHPLARPLQTVAGAEAGVVWAALPDRDPDDYHGPPDAPSATRIGRYDTRRFAFTPVVTLPGVRLTSAQLWVDSAANAAYVTVNNDVVRIPLPPGLGGK